MNDTAAPLKLGMIGLDTSHVIGFAKILNQPGDENHIPGATITHAYKGGSADFHLSTSRIDGFTQQLTGEFGVHLVDSIEALAETCDAIVMTSVDGRQHLKQFEILAPLKKPVFIDKPFAVTSEHAHRIAALSREHNTPVMSASSKRFTELLPPAIKKIGKDNILSAEFYGAMPIEETQGRYCWYGIHSADALFSAMGRGCAEVSTVTTDHYDLVIGRWQDGRIGTLRGHRTGTHKFAATLYSDEGATTIDMDKVSRPPYYYLIEKYLEFFRTGVSAIELDEIIEIIRFLEAADESAKSGKTVAL